MLTENVQRKCEAAECHSGVMSEILGSITPFPVHVFGDESRDPVTWPGRAITVSKHDRVSVCVCVCDRCCVINSPH